MERGSSDKGAPFGGNAKDIELNEDNNVSEPVKEMMFPSVDEMWEFYKEYGKQMGFPVMKRTSKRGNDGMLKWVKFSCSREGKTKTTSSNALKAQQNTKMECKARICACVDPDGRCRLTTVVIDHNHGLNPSKPGYSPCNTETSADVKRQQLEFNDKAGVRVNKSYKAVVVENGGYENAKSLESDCRSFAEKIMRLQSGEGDATADCRNYAEKIMRLQPGEGDGTADCRNYAEKIRRLQPGEGDVTGEQLRYDKMCSAFTKVADLAAVNEESFNSVMEWISNATNELPLKRRIVGVNNPTPKPTPTSIAQTHWSSPEYIIDSTVAVRQNIIDHKGGQLKGHTQGTRLQSTVPKKIKEEPKQVMPHRDVQMCGPSHSQVPEVTTTHEHMTHIGVYPTQKSMPLGGLHTQESLYSSMRFPNTNMTPFWGNTPGVANFYGRHQYSDPQIQFWNGGIDMNVAQGDHGPPMDDKHRD